LADANEAHDWRIYADFAQVLIDMARPMYASESLGFDLDNTVYALDSTTIDLCLSVFPWARFRARKAAIKLPTLLDVRGPIPTFIEISDAHLVRASRSFSGFQKNVRLASFSHPRRDYEDLVKCPQDLSAVSCVKMPRGAGGLMSGDFRPVRGLFKASNPVQRTPVPRSTAPRRICRFVRPPGGVTRKLGTRLSPQLPDEAEPVEARGISI
jgi:hypothetical protein